jgi:hypothetical protein
MRLTAHQRKWGPAIGFAGLIFLTCGVSAQQPASPIYDSATVVTITGTVQAVEQHQCSLGWRGRASNVIHPATWVGTHAILSTEYGIVDVHLGPPRFLEQHHFTLAKDDQIEVTGSKFAELLPVLIIAKELKRGHSFLELRDNTGKPLWMDDRSPVQSSRFAVSSFFTALTESGFPPNLGVQMCYLALTRELEPWSDVTAIRQFRSTFEYARCIGYALVRQNDLRNGDRCGITSTPSGVRQENLLIR